MDVSNLVIILIAVVVVVLVGIGLAFIFSSRSAKKETSNEKSQLENTVATSDKGVDVNGDIASTLELDPGKQVEVPQDFGLQLVLDNDQVFELSLPTTLGRSKDNSIEISDSSVSGAHARIFFDPRIGAVCIEDLDSLNGIFVDGRPTKINVLDDGARLTIGSVSLTFRDTGYLPPTR